MNTKNIKLNNLTIAMLAGIIIMMGCAKMDEPVPGSGVKKGATETNTKKTEKDGTQWVQIERLGRPAINEGLVISNDYLNAFNSIGPSLDLSTAAAPVVAQAGGVLTAVHNYGCYAYVGKPENAPTGNCTLFQAPAVSDVAGGFLPDVLRIDTSVRIAVGTWGYNGDLAYINNNGTTAILTGGRKIEDDVMDITLSYLIAGNPSCGPGVGCTISDGVNYEGRDATASHNLLSCSQEGQGYNPSVPGHKCLFGQTARNGSATFPFLANAN